MVGMLKPRRKMDPFSKIGQMLRFRYFIRRVERDADMDEGTPPASCLEVHDTDRFPTLSEGLQRLLDSSSAGDEQIRRIDIRFGAGGDGVYRYWVGRDEEWGAGQIPGP